MKVTGAHAKEDETIEPSIFVTYDMHMKRKRCIERHE